MPAKKREFECETCHSFHPNTMKQYTGYIERFGIYECVLCRRKRIKKETKEREQSPEKKAERRAKVYVQLTCPSCGVARETKKYGDPKRLCAKCNSRNMGKKGNKPTKPKLVKDVTCIDCGEVRSIQRSRKSPLRCSSCHVKSVKAKKKEEGIKKKATTIKRRESKQNKVTVDAKHLASSKDNTLTKDDQDAINMFIKKNGVKKIKPQRHFSDDKFQTGCIMSLGD